MSAEFWTLLEQGDVPGMRRAAMPLYWAVHGSGPDGPKERRRQVAAARLLIQAGADVNTTNKYGRSALAEARLCASNEMQEPPRESGAVDVEAP